MFTIKKTLRNLIITAFVACLALPGVASATYMLDLTTANPTFASGTFASGSIFTDPAGLGWDLTISGFANGSPADLKTNTVGMGVAGPNNALDPFDSILFQFNPSAMLEGFTINNGSNDNYYCTVIGSPNISCGFVTIGPSTPTIDISVVSTATSLEVGSISGSGFRIGALSFADAVASVPEPSILGLMGFGLLGMAGLRRIKKTA